MTEPASKLTLMAHLGMPIVRRIANRGLLGRVNVRIQDFMFAGFWLYQTGAVLGRARSDYASLLAKMLVIPGENEHRLAEFLLDLGTERLRQYSGEPNSFLSLFYSTEWQNFGYSWPYDYKAIDSLGSRKMKLDRHTELKLKMFVVEGIGLGVKQPDLTALMWKNTWDTPDHTLWRYARQAGLDIPEAPTRIPLVERERDVLLQVADYATRYHPELLDPLRL